MTAPTGGTPTAGTPATPPTPRTTTASPVATAAPAQSTTSARPTASPSQAGHNPNVIIPRSQMTPAQQRALDRHNAEAIAHRDAIVEGYLRSVLPSDEDEAAPSERQSDQPNGES